MFEADGGNEIVHIMDRVTGSILTGSARLDSSTASSRSCTRHRRTRRATSTPARPSTAAASRSSRTSSATTEARKGNGQRSSCRLMLGSRSGIRVARHWSPSRRGFALTRSRLNPPRRRDEDEPSRACDLRRGVSWPDAAVCAQIVHAHEFKLDAVINAFVKIEPGEAAAGRPRAAVSVQVGPGFRSTMSRSTSTTSAPAVERALAALQQDIVLFENGRPLVASRACGAICRCRPIARSRATSRPTTSRRRAARTRHAAFTSIRATSMPASPIRSARRTRCSLSGRPPRRELGDYLQAGGALHAVRRREPGDGHHQQLRERGPQPHAGFAPRPASSGSASRTSSPATIICCSCFAW